VTVTDVVGVTIAAMIGSLAKEHAIRRHAFFRADAKALQIMVTSTLAGKADRRIITQSMAATRQELPDLSIPFGVHVDAFGRILDDQRHGSAAGFSMINGMVASSQNHLRVRSSSG
jgi:hypothetical protein